jgi:enamine deaminase RidA (YjgF/YER057c/UK114 family)
MQYLVKFEISQYVCDAGGLPGYEYVKYTVLVQDVENFDAAINKIYADYRFVGCSNFENMTIE